MHIVQTIMSNNLDGFTMADTAIDMIGLGRGEDDNRFLL
jgi:hypothetical protein